MTKRPIGMAGSFLLVAMLIVSSTASIHAQKVAVAPSGTKKAPEKKADAGLKFEGALDIRIHPEEGKLKPAGELLLNDPQGRRTGKDARTNKTYQEILVSYYERESLADDVSGAPGPQTATINVQNPITGEYHLQVIGRVTGKYDLEVTGEDREGNPSKAEFTNVKIRKGAVHNYVISYSNKPNSKIEVTSK